MFYEQKAQKNNMIQKCISNLKDNLAENKTRTHAKKEIILYNNNNSRRNFKVNHSTLNAFNKTINYKSLHNSKEKFHSYYSKKYFFHFYSKLYYIYCPFH